MRTNVCADPLHGTYTSSVSYHQRPTTASLPTSAPRSLRLGHRVEHRCWARCLLALCLRPGSELVSSAADGSAPAGIKLSIAYISTDSRKETLFSEYYAVSGVRPKQIVGRGSNVRETKSARREETKYRSEINHHGGYDDL